MLEAEVLLQLAPAAAVVVAELTLVRLQLGVLELVLLQSRVAGAGEGALVAAEHQALQVARQLGAAHLQRRHALLWVECGWGWEDGEEGRGKTGYRGRGGGGAVRGEKGIERGRMNGRVGQVKRGDDEEERMEQQGREREGGWSDRDEITANKSTVTPPNLVTLYCFFCISIIRGTTQAFSGGS